MSRQQRPSEGANIDMGNFDYETSDDVDRRPPSINQPSEINGSSRRGLRTDDFEPANSSRQIRHVEREAPTEFQRYVAGSLGEMLPIFGSSLFQGVPATFAPSDRAPVGPDYLISSGDELQITVWGQLNFTRRVLVDRSGLVTLPDAGPITLAGLNYLQASDVLKANFSRLYKNFDVSVTLGRLHSVQVFVVGEARRPGSYTVSSLSTLVNAIFASGGPSARGSMRSIQLKRGNSVISNFDLYDLLLLGDKSKDVPLAQGDVIFIPAAGPRIALAGSIEHPAIYELKPDTTLQDVLRLADGASPLASSTVRLERIEHSAALQIVTFDLSRERRRIRLQNGDVIRVLALVPRFDNAVTLKGNVADSGRYPWKEGMHLSDLIPDKTALLTRNYWKEHNALGAPGESEPQDGFGGPDQQQPEINTKTPDSDLPVAGTKTRAVPISYQEQQRNTRGDSSLAAATELDNTPPLRTFNPSNNVQPVAPEINWQYAVLERMDRNTLETQKIPFNLGKLVLEHDPSQNLQLEPGDVVTVFSKADFSVPSSQQVKEVRIEGEVMMAGIYPVKPGETLRQLVERAGGFTSNAYLYGAQFTREATRREQQKRYEDFLNQYERDADQAAANLSSRITSTQQAATAQASIASQRDLIDKLRKVSMNGRIVLNIPPNAQDLKALPDVPLENGDRLYVPSKPLTVNVMGNVFEQTSFLYQEDFHTGDYLKKAGGPSRDADRSHIFVIRADGSVVSKAVTSSLFSRNFEVQRMYPGDTIVVPTILNRATFLRSLTDWSQVFSNFALGAAAVNILH